MHRLNRAIHLPSGEIIPKGTEVTVFAPIQTQDVFDENGKCQDYYDGYTDTFSDLCFLYQSEHGVSVVMVNHNQLR